MLYIASMRMSGQRKKRGMEGGVGAVANAVHRSRPAAAAARASQSSPKETELRKDSQGRTSNSELLVGRSRRKPGAPSSSPAQMGTAGPALQDLPLADRRRILTVEIKKRINWVQLQQLYARHRGDMGVLNINALLMRTVHVVEQSEILESKSFAATVGQCLDDLSANLAELGTREVSNVLWAIAKLGVGPGAAIVPRLCAKAEAMADECNAQVRGFVL